MPRTCSQCGTKLPSDSLYCFQCGQAQNAPAGRDPRADGSQAESDRRFPLWQILPWTLLAAVLLMMVPLLRHSHSQTASAVQSPAMQLPAVQPPAMQSPPTTLPAVVPMTRQAADSAAGGTGKSPQAALSSAASSSAAPVSAAPISVGAAPVPLTVSLYSASRGKHVAVGTPVTISAYAALPPGHSATLAVSYGKDSSPRSLLALTQGSLSSTTWTPFLPGRYLFTASALDSRKNGAFSHPLTIWADAPVHAPAAKPAAPIRLAARPAAARPSITRPTVAKPRAPKLRPAAAKVVAAKVIAAVTLSQPRPATPKRHSAPASVPTGYRVAAAEFPVRRVALTLVGALRSRGFNALVRSGLSANHKPSYKVETGDFTRRADADTQVRLLKQDGYPAFVFQAH